VCSELLYGLYGMVQKRPVRQTGHMVHGVASPKGGTMENSRVEALRDEVCRLLKKQTSVLESRSLGTVSDNEILEYEIRQEMIHEICDQLAHSAAAASQHSPFR